MDHNPACRTMRTQARRRVDGDTKRHGFCVVALECDRLHAGGSFHALRDIDEVIVGRGEHKREWSDPSAPRLLHLELPDLWMSKVHARLLRREEQWFLEDCGSTNGSQHNGERVSACALQDGDRIQLGHTFLLLRDGCEGVGDLETYAETERTRADLPGLTTLSPVNAARLTKLLRIAPSSIPVLLAGESGTGKELLARAVHTLSMRPGPFVAINCGAIPLTLIEAQLFGHTKGSFSGATRDEQGFVRSANFGTLFLDEIGDLPASSQAALLRVLQQGEVVPIGSTKPIPVDIRVLSATHQPLDALMESGAFRRDLYARIAGFIHEAPPLRERREDIGLLIAALLGATTETNVRLRPEVGEAFLRYGWPLNIRELEQCLASAKLLTDDEVLRLSHLPEPIASATTSPPGASASLHPASLAPPPPELSEQDAALREELVRGLAQCSGNVSAVAREMGKARQQVQRWIRRLRIGAEEYAAPRGAGEPDR